MMRTLREKDTEAAGERVARMLRISAKLPHAAVVVGLVGELGAGKTTFLRGFARGLGIRRRLTSPTFVLARRYRIPKKFHLPPSIFPGRGVGQILPRWFWHIDVYRLRGPRDLSGIEFQEIIQSPANIVAVEWADRIRGAMPKHTAWIQLRHRARGRDIVVRK